MSSPSPCAEFVKLYTGCQSRLYAFILALTGNSEMTADVLQETNLVLWAKFDQFEIGTNFMGWAFQTARFQVMASRTKQSRDRLVFSDETLALVAAAFEKRDEKMADRQVLLKRCVEKLPERTREMMLSRYQRGESLEFIAKLVGRSYHAVGQAMHRARKALAKCIEMHEGVARE